MLFFCYWVGTLAEKMFEGHYIFDEKEGRVVEEKNYSDRRVYWVWLTMVLGAANESFWRLCRGYRSISDFAENVRECRFSDMSEAQCERAQSLTYDDAEALIERCADEKVQVVIFRDERYPQRLKHTPNPPPVLFAKGDIGILGGRRNVSVVGTRTPCDYSLKAARTLCADLARKGAVIITGGEAGIDTAAVEGVLAENGRPAVLLGKGIFEQRTREDTLLQTAEKGVLLSEYTDSVTFRKVSYDSRNRILCGLCDMVLFIEARADSRGLNNVKHAERLNRPVFCVPPADIFDTRFKGQERLLRHGAQPAFGAEQILSRYGELTGETVRSVKFADIKTNKHNEREKTADMSVKNVKKVDESTPEGLHNSEKSAKIDMSGLSQTQKCICELLSEKGTLHLNQIAESTEIPVSEVMTELTMLTLKGMVTELPGKSYRL